MRITCPHCEASYDVPDRMIGAGRTVRCKRCAGIWAVAAPVPEPAPEPALLPTLEMADGVPPAFRSAFAQAPVAVSGPEPAAAGLIAGHTAETAADVDRPAIAAPERLIPPAPGTAPRPRATPLTWAAWAASVLVLGAALAGALIQRDGIRRSWPPSARAYALLGFHAPPATEAASVPEVAQPAEHH